jgi:magnesium transporter
MMRWHQIHEPSDPELDKLAALYSIHPLHIEDCRHRNQNAKIEDGVGYIFAVLKPVAIADSDLIETADLDVILGPDWVITVQESAMPAIRGMLDGLRVTPASLRPDLLFYRIFDAVVDSYLPVLDHFDDLIDEMEDRVLRDPTPDCLARIFEIKRSLIVLRRVLANTRDVAGHLQRSESDLIQRDMWPFLRDIYDHVARNLDTVEMLRDLLSGALDVYLSAVANRTNQVMKVLTVLGTIALPVLVISGIYGMNVKGLPWMEAPHASLILGGLMAASTAGLLALLKWLRWL